DTAKRIRILYVFFRLCDDLASFEEFEHAIGRDDLPFMRPYQVDELVERLDATVEPFKGERAGEGRQVRIFAGFQQYMDAISAHELRTVQQCQPFFRLEDDRFPAESGLEDGSIGLSPIEPYFPLPQ